MTQPIHSPSLKEHHHSNVYLIEDYLIKPNISVARQGDLRLLGHRKESSERFDLLRLSLVYKKVCCKRGARASFGLLH